MQVAAQPARKRALKPLAVKGASWWQYRLYCWLARVGWRLFGGRIEVTGLERVPRQGACLLIPNHQSNLEPILLNTIIPRIVHPMAKSSQFHGVLGFMLSHVYGFPVRRYQVDSQAARNVLRRLAAGAAVKIYIEGERTWDGRLQPFRLGVLHLILKAGVPVIPVRIDGAFEAWPRWERKPRPAVLRFHFGEPLQFPKLERRADRTPDQVNQVRQSLRAALSGPLDR